MTEMQLNKTRSDIWMDLLLMAFLIGLNVATRLLPHVPGVLPVAASGLFAARGLRIPALALAVPLLGMTLSDMALRGDDWSIAVVGFVAFSMTAVVGVLSKYWLGYL